MELVGVGHGTTDREYLLWKRLAQALSASTWTVLDTGVPAVSEAQPNLVSIANDTFEFGAYQRVREVVKTSGPYLVVNDTLFATHSVWLWKKLLGEAVLKGMPHAMYGDATASPDDKIAEIPHPYYSSWIFLIRDRPHLDLFCQAVATTTGVPLAEPSEGYSRYLDAWLQPKSKWYGWHGKKSEASLQRKRRTIAWEHALSHTLQDHDIVSFSVISSWHRLAQMADKIRRHWASFVNS